MQISLTISTYIFERKKLKKKLNCYHFYFFIELFVFYFKNTEMYPSINQFISHLSDITFIVHIFILLQVFNDFLQEFLKPENPKYPVFYI